MEYDIEEFQSNIEELKKLTIMRGICAFLNTKVGGKIYAN
jgi:hypothetical protein